VLRRVDRREAIENLREKARPRGTTLAPGFAAGTPTFYNIHICRLYTPSLAPPRSSLNSYREPRVIPTRATRQKAPKSKQL